MTMETKQAAELLSNLKNNIAKVIVGKDETVELLLTALVCGGHAYMDIVRQRMKAG